MKVQSEENRAVYFCAAYQRYPLHSNCLLRDGCYSSMDHRMTLRGLETRVYQTSQNTNADPGSDLVLSIQLII